MMSWVGNTRPLPRPGPAGPAEPPPAPPRRARDSALTRCTAVLTAVIMLLALLVGGTKLLAVGQGFAGAPAAEVTGHVLAAVAALGLQIVLRRGRLAVRAFATLALLAIGMAVFWFYWFA